MSDADWVIEGFEQNRTRLRAIAYRMLGSLAEAEDAVQDVWLRASSSDAAGVANLDAWLTTITARVCLNALRSRTTRHEEPAGVHVPDPVVSPAERMSPEDAALLSESVGLALQVVLDALAPAERLALVLHDLFGLPFEEIAPLVGRSPANTRQLASRARRRVRAAEAPDPDLSRQRRVVDAFFAAAHGGDLDALVEVLDPDVVLRSDGGTAFQAGSTVLHGAAAVAGWTRLIAQPSAVKRPALVNGAAGVVATLYGRPVAVIGFTVAGGKIVAIDALLDPERLALLDLADFDHPSSARMASA